MLKFIELRLKKIIFLLFSILGYFILAQETLPIYQQYLLDGKYLINSAHYGETDYLVLQGTYQKQFSKFDLSPNVQSVGFHANIVDRLGAGATFFRDQNGPISSNGATIGASYFIPLSDAEDRKEQFSFGTSVNFYNMNFDLSMLNTLQVGDPLLQEGVNSIFMLYSNLGAQATYKGFFAGVSVLDIPLTNDRPMVNGIEPSSAKYIFNGGYDYVVTEGISIEPSILLNLNANSARMMDLNLMAKVFNDRNLFSTGVSFRTAVDSFGNQQLSLSPIIRGKIDRFTFGATYNMGLSNIQTQAGNSFMLSVGYNFENFINRRGYRYR